MDGNQFEQFVAQMLGSIKSTTDWTFENQRREIEDLDQKLYAAEVVLRRALEFVLAERNRIKAQPKQAEQANLNKLHEEMVNRVQHEKPRELPRNQAKQGQPF